MLQALDDLAGVERRAVVGPQVRRVAEEGRPVRLAVGVVLQAVDVEGLGLVAGAEDGEGLILQAGVAAAARDVEAGRVPAPPLPSGAARA